MNLDLTDDEIAAPLSPRLEPLRAILEKLEPPKPRPELPPPLKAYDAPMVRRRRRE
jgi:hypothetical protein